MRYEVETSTRVRAHNETHNILNHTSQTVEIDFGLAIAAFEKLQELVSNLREGQDCR